MQEIKFDLGKNIVETARASGVPQFETRDVVGFISYSVAGVPKEMPARYTRPGYEIVWQPLFAFTMYADRDRDASIPVQTVSLQLKQHLTSHEAAQAFVEQTIAQFAKGKWQRYSDPEWEVMLTGRSSYLNETGQIDSKATGALDPAYRVPPLEWPDIAAQGARWDWVGDGVLATLHVRNLPDSGGRLDYRMDLEFELLDMKLRRDAENHALKLKEGDAKGWNSTAKHEAAKKQAQERNKRLAANAVKRGDDVVSLP